MQKEKFIQHAHLALGEVGTLQMYLKFHFDDQKSCNILFQNPTS